MSDDEEGEDWEQHGFVEEEWEQGDLLAGANALNGKIKEYIGSHANNADRNILEKYKTTILGYQASIGAQEFDPRSDRLTKAGIEDDLRNHLRMIDSVLSRGIGNKKRKSKKSKRSKRSRRRRRSRRSRRRSKRSRRRRAIKRWSQ
jgi:hypothetical protein